MPPICAQCKEDMHKVFEAICDMDLDEESTIGEEEEGQLLPIFEAFVRDHCICKIASCAEHMKVADDRKDPECTEAIDRFVSVVSHMAKRFDCKC